MWKDHRICSVLLLWRKEFRTSGWELSRKKMQLSTKNTQQDSFSSVSSTVGLKTTLRADSHSWVRQMTFKALYSPLEDTTSLSVTDALAVFVKAKLTEPDLGSPPYEGVVQFWFCSLVFIFPFLIFLCSLKINRPNQAQPQPHQYRNHSGKLFFLFLSPTLARKVK